MLVQVPLILRNALRNRRRSILTTASIAVSLCLLGILLTLYIGMFYRDYASPQEALRLMIRHKVSLTQEMPTSYKPRILSVAGVVDGTFWQWFGGTYKDNRDANNMFARFAVEPEHLFNVRSEMIVAPDVKSTFEHQRTACIAGEALAKKLGWKTGERITLQGDFLPVNLDMTLAGTYDDPDHTQILFLRWDYLQDSLPAKGRDKISTFLILADSPDHVPGICKTIDAMFDNSPAPTKTESEKDFGLSFVAFLGNLKMFLAAISGAVMFTILLVLANTVAMTVRERTRETGILRTLGFAPSEILSLILGEAIVLGMIGGVIGALLAAVLCSGLAKASASFGGFRFPNMTPIIGEVVVIIAVVIALLSAVVPAWFAARKPVVDSIRYTG